MTDAAATVMTLSFGDPEAGVWGSAWIPGSGQPAFIGLWAAGHVTLPRVGVDGFGEAAEWRLEGDGAELVVSPAGQAVTPTPDAAIPGFEQLCRVRGAFDVDGAEQHVDCLGLRGALTGAPDLDRFESFREVSAWFEPADGLAVVVLRPRGNRGHDSDLVSAALLDGETVTAVADPRLSTTYATSGRPARVSVELWLDGDEEETRYPRRAAGEAIGTRAQATVGALDLQTELFRWHSRGREGAGVYLTAQRG